MNHKATLALVFSEYKPVHGPTIATICIKSMMYKGKLVTLQCSLQKKDIFFSSSFFKKVFKIVQN